MHCNLILKNVWTSNIVAMARWSSHMNTILKYHKKQCNLRPDSPTPTSSPLLHIRSISWGIKVQACTWNYITSMWHKPINAQLCLQQCKYNQAGNGFYAPINVNPVGGEAGTREGFDKNVRKLIKCLQGEGGRKFRSNKGNFPHPREKSYIF
jgi:hypothetical protein